MPAQERRATYHHGDLREGLIQATRELVEAKGPEGFSVSEACRLASVSTAAPYRHFADRGELLEAVALTGFDELTASFIAALEGKEPGSVAAITAIGVAYVTFAEANPGLFRMMFAVCDRSEEMEASGENCYGILLQQVAIAIGTDLPEPELVRTAFPLWTFVHGLAFLRIDGKMEQFDITDSVEDLVLNAGARLLAR